MLFILVHFNNELAQTLEILLLLGLLKDYLLLNHPPCESRMRLKQGQNQLAEGTLCEKQVVVCQNCCLILLTELLKVCGQLSVKLLVL